VGRFRTVLPYTSPPTGDFRLRREKRIDLRALDIPLGKRPGFFLSHSRHATLRRFGSRNLAFHYISVLMSTFSNPRSMRRLFDLDDLINSMVLFWPVSGFSLKRLPLNCRRVSGTAYVVFSSPSEVNASLFDGSSIRTFFLSIRGPIRLTLDLFFPPVQHTPAS